jgi:hypothetical protein
VTAAIGQGTMGRRTPGRRAVLPFEITFEVMDADAFAAWAAAHAPGSAPGAAPLIGLDVVVARCVDRHGGLLALASCSVDTRPAWTGPYGGLDEATAAWVVFEVLIPALRMGPHWPGAGVGLELGRDGQARLTATSRPEASG